jgi:hypothetical protein
MSEISVGTTVKHKVSGNKGVVTAINGKDAIVSHDFDKTTKIALVALEPWDADKEAVRGAVAPYQF